MATIAGLVCIVSLDEYANCEQNMRIGCVSRVRKPVRRSRPPGLPIRKSQSPAYSGSEEETVALIIGNSEKDHAKPQPDRDQAFGSMDDTMEPNVALDPADSGSLAPIPRRRSSDVTCDFNEDEVLDLLAADILGEAGSGESRCMAGRRRRGGYAACHASKRRRSRRPAGLLFRG
jgi:hypothetical protein